VGTANYSGDLGLAVNRVEAVRCFSLAAAQGYGLAKLALLNQAADGVPEAVKAVRRLGLKP